MSQLSQTGRFFRRWWPALVTGAVMLVVIGVVGLVALVEWSAPRPTGGFPPAPGAG